MDINLLVINVGNTRVAVGVFAAGELVYTQRLLVTNLGDLGEVLTEAWGRISSDPDAEIAAAGVQPALVPTINSAVLSATGQSVLWVPTDIKIPIKITTDHPGATGADRALNLAAAYEQMGKACVVVDAGTAVTVDLCNDAGEFIGGAISPGVRLMLDSLHTNAAQLPEVDFQPPIDWVGRDTTQAIRHGVYYALRGLVKETVENYAVGLGTWPDIICTGGDAEALFGGWELVHAVSPDLTLYGIALAYAERET